MEKNAWLEDLFASIDAMDAERFAGFITEEGMFKYGSGPEARGRSAIVEAVAGFFSSIAGIGHTLHGMWEVEGRRFVQGDVTYQMHDGRTVSVPFLNLFVMEGDKVREYLVYTDPTPMMG